MHHKLGTCQCWAQTHIATGQSDSLTAMFVSLRVISSLMTGRWQVKTSQGFFKGSLDHCSLSFDLGRRQRLPVTEGIEAILDLGTSRRTHLLQRGTHDMALRLQCAMTVVTISGVRSRSFPFVSASACVQHEGNREWSLSPSQPRPPYPYNVYL